VHLELIDTEHDARAVHANFVADPAGIFALLQMSTTEVAQEQGVVAVMLDEVAPLALLAQLAL
jgi:hypothetical protein